MTDVSKWGKRRQPARQVLCQVNGYTPGTTERSPNSADHGCPERAFLFLLNKWGSTIRRWLGERSLPQGYRIGLTSREPGGGR